MKLVPLGDRVVLKQLEAEETTGTDKRKTSAGRSCCGRTRWNG